MTSQNFAVYQTLFRRSKRTHWRSLVVLTRQRTIKATLFLNSSRDLDQQQENINLLLTHFKSDQVTYNNFSLIRFPCFQNQFNENSNSRSNDPIFSNQFFLQYYAWTTINLSLFRPIHLPEKQLQLNTLLLQHFVINSELFIPLQSRRYPIKNFAKCKKSSSTSV